MSDLRINDVDPNLLAKLKSKAALERTTLREFVIKLLEKAAK
jgi:hypothetical protein